MRFIILESGLHTYPCRWMMEKDSCRDAGMRRKRAFPSSSSSHPSMSRFRGAQSHVFPSPSAPLRLCARCLRVARPPARNSLSHRDAEPAEGTTIFLTAFLDAREGVAQMGGQGSGVEKRCRPSIDCCRQWSRRQPNSSGPFEMELYFECDGWPLWPLDAFPSLPTSDPPRTPLPLLTLTISHPPLHGISTQSPSSAGRGHKRPPTAAIPTRRRA